MTQFWDFKLSRIHAHLGKSALSRPATNNITAKICQNKKASLTSTVNFLLQEEFKGNISMSIQEQAQLQVRCTL